MTLPLITPLNTGALIGLTRVQEIVREFFPDVVSKYTRMDARDYHGLVAEAQTVLNGEQMARFFVNAMRSTIAEYLGDNQITFQSKLYLRAARPSNGSDVVGWHRESFYGAPPQTVNFWIPVANVTRENCLYHIPASDQLAPTDLTVIQEVDRSVEPGSPSHHIGLLYAPKVIVGGVDLTEGEPLYVPSGQCALFPGELIHGAAMNRTDKIRFSLDLRVLAFEYLYDAKLGYFEPLDS